MRRLLRRRGLSAVPTALVVAVVVAVVGAPATVAAAATCPAPGGASIPNAANPPGAAFVAYGRGYGHNLGMSQYGAEGAARLGCTASQILDTYYAGTHVATSTTLQPTVMLVLLNTTPSGSATVTAQTGAITWNAVQAGLTAVQPTGTTWKVVPSKGGEALVDPAAVNQPKLFITSNDELRAVELGPGSQPGVNVARVRTFTGTSVTTDLQLDRDYTRFVTGPAGMKVWQVIPPTGATSGIQKYLWGLAEVPVVWPDASLQAQAIAARTYLVNGFWSPTSNAYVIGTTPATQNYTGYAKEVEDSHNGLHWYDAVNATNNQVVETVTGATISAMYTSSHGGRSEDERYVYGGAGKSYLLPVDDSAWDLASDNPHRSWSKGFTKASLAAIFGMTTVSAVTVAPWGSPSRNNGVTVTGVAGGLPVSHTYTGSQMRALLGTLSPSMTYAWPLSDTVPPVAHPSAGPGATFRWSATDAAPSSGIASYAVTVAHGATVDYTTAATTATSLTMVGVPGTTYQLTVTATDRSGNVSAPAVASVALPLPATFHPVPPVRILDTRSGLGSTGALAGGGSLTLAVAGATGSPVPAGATGVVLALTAVSPTAPGWLSAGPVVVTTASNVSFTAGLTAASDVVAQLSPTGTVVIHNGSAGAVNVLADVQGFLTSDTSGSTYVPVAPSRIVDTRTGLGAPAAVAAKGSATIQVTGAAGVPNGATGVVVNVTAIGGSAAGYFSAGPVASPTTSSVSFAAHQTVAGLTLSQLSGTGTLTLYNGGTTAAHVVVDVLGYLVPGGGLSYDPIGPARALDTRSSGGPLAVNGTRTVSVAGVAGSAVPSSATAVVVSLTAVAPTAPGFLSLGPVASTTTSNLNFASGVTTSNLVVAQLSPTGTITVSAGGTGTVRVLVDVLGYLSP